MIALTVGQVAQAVGGVLSIVGPDVLVLDVVTDSSAATAGCMFVAVAGENVDGHDYAAHAVAAGCVVVLARRTLAGADGQQLPCIVVDDPVLALGSLASWYRDQLVDCQVIAITGSSGKTSTKDLVASILSTLGPTARAQGSFNTEIGLPLTILSADLETRYLVVEMGMRGPGHIAYLSRIARPNIGCVVNVGTAHLGMLGTRQAIADAKGELIDSLLEGDVAVLNADDPIVSAMARRTLAAVVTFGEAAESAVRATDIRLDSRAQPTFTLVDQRAFDVDMERVALQFSGRHYVSNAAAAAAIALSAGASLEQVATALRDARPASRWRMEIGDTGFGVIVVNDAYNANPDSMRAALRTLAAMSGRSWAVLGEMRELGDESAEQHEAVGRLAIDLGISRVVWVGEGTLPAHEAALRLSGVEGRSVYVPDVESALGVLERELEPGDVVLVKASRSVGLERVASGLLGGAST
ncbi:MAG: UDP-N-acetylmuramoyl-tripeptide--D-alanyl-D-alanine ligase [bacterium]|nr:UDP-N-acetylmuramoyl-tripeptide--D-alanyl-D-alanine ligase [bacterium]